VVVSLEGDEDAKTGWLEVSDRGIGMTSDVIRTYFLRAGASFRRSDAWRKQHEEDAGKSRVLRSGRFGVGVLAAFLLGEEIEVSSRHVDAPADGGVYFKAGIDSNEIELRHHHRAVGTTVRIKISDKRTWDSLMQTRFDWRTGMTEGLEGWDWYCLSKPKVLRKLRLKKDPEVLNQQFSLPPPGSIPPVPWHAISHPDYSDIHWTYAESPQLACNGIVVIGKRDTYFYYRESEIKPLWETHGLSLRCPNVSVFDRDGHLPLLLQRTGLADDRYPFHSKLLDDVVRDFLAFVLVNAPSQPGNRPEHSPLLGWYQGFGIRKVLWKPFFFVGDGTSFVDPWNIRAAPRSERVLVHLSHRSPGASFDGINAPTTVFGVEPNLGPQDLRAWLRCGLCDDGNLDFGPAARWPVRTGARMLLKEKTYQEFQQPGLIAKYYWHKIKVDLNLNGWVLLRYGKASDSGMDFRALMADPAKGEFDGLTEWYLAKEQSDPADQVDLSPVAKAWQEVLGSVVIPYDLNERHRKFASAYDSLKTYIAGQEKLREELLKKSKKAKG
jgi:molecular chaperone HtpG